MCTIARKWTSQRLTAASAGAGEKLDTVLCPTTGELRDLLAATEAIGDEKSEGTGGLNGGQEAILRDDF
jgi:hypothetical protein